MNIESQTIDTTALPVTPTINDLTSATPKATQNLNSPEGLAAALAKLTPEQIAKALATAGKSLPVQRSPIGRMREILCTNPAFSVKELKAALAREGIALADSTINTVYQQTNATLKVLQTLSMLKAPKTN